MNKSYCDEVSENLTAFVTECIFVDYVVKERRGKQKVAFLAATWFTINISYLYNYSDIMPKCSM